MTKTPKPNPLSKPPSPLVLTAIGGGLLCVVFTIWIFAPGGFLDSLTAPSQEAEAPSELLVPEQEEEHVSADLSAEKNEAFLAENAKKEGVKVTKSGLQIRVVKAGAGKSPGATDTVKVHYTGTFINGKVFDSSVERGEPIEFPLDGVIAGWTEGLQLMKEGEKAELVIPQDLAYGRGRPGIPPYQTLIFQVELLKVQK